MNDRELDEALRGLPRQVATHGFADRVLARLDERRGSPRRALRAALAVAVLSAAMPVALWWHGVAERAAIKSQLQELRVEYDSLKRQLATLRTGARGRQPLVVIDSDDQADYVVALDTLLATPSPPRRRPAAPPTRTGESL